MHLPKINRCLKALTVFISVLSSGCASTQLNYNARDLASSVVDDLILKQILFNLSRIYDTPYAIPSQVSIPSGSATTTNSLTPQISGPFNSLRTATAQTASAATVTRTAIDTVTSPNGTFNVSSNDQWSQNWTLNPLSSDPDQLRRLRTLYRYGARQLDDDEFVCEYPLIEKSSTGGATAPAGTVTVPLREGKPPMTIVIGPAAGGAENEKPKTQYYRLCGDNDRSGKPGRTPVNPDPSFLRQPSCILCEGKRDGTQVLLIKNKKLKNDWLRFFDSPFLELPQGVTSLGRYGNHFLYAVSPAPDKPLDAQRSYYDFALFILEASRQSAQPTSGSSAGKSTIQGPASPTFELH